MQEFGSSSSVVMVYDHLHVHYVHMYVYNILYMTMSQNIIIPYCTCNIWTSAKYTQNQPTPIRILSFLVLRGSLTKTANQAAFQKLSEAFEQLQPAASHPATGEKNKLKRKREKPWWDVPTWEATWVEWNVWGSNQESFCCWLVMVLILDVSLKNVI